jgi:hypothetical protein
MPSKRARWSRWDHRSLALWETFVTPLKPVTCSLRYFICDAPIETDAILTDQQKPVPNHVQKGLADVFITRNQFH